MPPMRRFELVDGKSEKFWEVEVEGSSVTTRWGRIGTDGQIKTKPLADAAAAEREAGKLVTSKTKKGYVEVPPADGAVLAPAASPAAPAQPAAPAASAPTASAPTASSVPAAAAAPVGAAPASPPRAEASASTPDEDVFVVPSHWKANLHVRRGWEVGPSLDFRPEVQLERIRKAHPKVDLPTAETLGSWSEAQRVELQTKLAEQGPRWEPDPSSEAWIRFVFACEGLIPALRLVIRHPRFEDTPWSVLAPGLRCLRAALAWADAPTRAEAETLLATLEGEARTDVHRFYLLPEVEAFADAARAHSNFHYDHLISISVDDLSEVELRGPIRSDIGGIESLVVQHREAVLPVLEPWLDIDDADVERTVIDAVGALPSERALGILFDRVQRRSVLAALPGLFERFPRRCMRVAAGRAAMDDHLLGWVAARPDLAADVAAESEALASALRKVQARLAPAHPDASPEQLPAFFRTPPWRGKPSKRKPIKLQVDLPEPSIHLNEAETAVGEAAVAAARAVEQVDEHFYRHRPEQLLRVILDGDDARRDEIRREVLARYWFDGTMLRKVAFGLCVALPDRAAADIAAIGHGDEELLDVKEAIRDPALAEYFLAALGKKTLRARGLAWGARHPEYAARAWIPAALGSAAKLRGLAESGLRHVAAQAGRAPVEAAAAIYGDAAKVAVSNLLDADPLAEWPHKPAKLDFVNLAVIPRPRLADAPLLLPREATEVLIEAFSASKPDEVYPGVEVAKTLLEPRSLAELAWGVFKQWLDVGSPSKQNWALSALGMVGDDEVAHRLTPMVRAWPGESQHQRAVAGLDVLLAIGTDVALMHLNGIAQKVKFKGVKEAAQTRIQALAESLELTPDQLADRLVPSLDLELDGTLELDYGPRKFVVGFDETLKPFVKDGQGKQLKSLPKPGAKDDPERAGPAEAQFKALKKSVRSLASLQIARLENAMVVARRWTVPDFEGLLVGHPLMIHLVRRLVWGIYRDGALVGTFRVGEDRSYADAQDEGLSLEAGLEVGLVHPIELDGATAAAWGEVLADYEILQPFQQLGRITRELSEEEKQSPVLERDAGTKIPVGRVLGLLGRGWDRGPALDGGVVSWLVRPLADGEHELHLYLGEAGLWTGMGGEQDDDPTFEKICVARRGQEFYYSRSQPEFQIGDLPVGLVSDLIATVEGLVAPS